MNAPPVLAHLRDALAERYTVEREIGRGGMATVYLAHDLKHSRVVALKVLHPELANALGPDRFLREIKIAAGLNHPNILSLYDSGTWTPADGAPGLYYAMPFVEGESLRSRLTRECQLPVEDALRVAGDVASALAHAHGQGVIHRDIKPENILLSGSPPHRGTLGDSHVFLADFGIAKALDSVGAERLTETGLSLGTPAYMSPEQASGEHRLDPRSDLYALGCVLYEMLAGQPPFTGATARAILARHALDPVPSLRSVRPTVAESLDRTVTRVLAKVPADRFATAVEFGQALTARERPPRWAPSRPSARRIARVVPAALTTIVLAVGAYLRWQGPPPAVGADPGLVAVLPFRVAGAAPALGYLREGIVDLLAVKLTGEGGPRALDPRALLSSWHRALHLGASDLSPDAAVKVALGLGAGRLVDGGVVGTPENLVLTASVLTVPAGAIRSRASVTGTADSLPALVDRLIAQLLAGESGRTELSTLTSLPALRAYIDGQAALRAGRFKDAFRSFNHALDLDSTFALAGVGLNEAKFWDGGNDNWRGLRLAWAGRDRLSARDRALITPWVGPNGPNGRPPSDEEALVAVQQIVAAVPESPEAWYELGDRFYHWGALMGYENHLQRAAEAFRRSLDLDSSYAEPLLHLFDLSAAEGDTSSVRRLGNIALAADSGSDNADYLRWQMAYTLRDTAALARIRARFDQLSGRTLYNIFERSQETGARPDDARRAVTVLLKRADSDSAREQPLRLQYMLAMNSGRPREGLAVINQHVQQLEGGDELAPGRITDALYWDGDSAIAATAVRERGRGTRVLASNAEDRRSQYDDICFVQQWRLAHGELGAVRPEIARLRAAVVPGLSAADSASMAASASMCADLLEAWLATAARQPNAAGLVARLDSLVSHDARGWWADGWNLVLARLLEQQGKLPRALATVRRREYGLRTPPYLSTYLREEGRLAALVGDTAAAIRSYQHYLALRSNPEPAWRPETDQVRAELAKLLAEPRQ
jgi:eukaryotic-like serine/threonine-protein kinase